MVSSVSSHSSRLPRARGDRPRESVVIEHELASAPRPRGSAPCWKRPTVCPRVCPAPAGIGPDPRALPQPPGCLPRARGDRPLFDGRRYRIRESAPRPRGSASDPSERSLAACVCPAPAGIGLFGLAGSSSKYRLPRARGDRPETARQYGERVLSAPRPRGSALWI